MPDRAQSHEGRLMDEREYLDELDHLVRDAYMPDEKKIAAIDKLARRFFSQDDARCAEIVAVAIEMLEVLETLEGALDLMVFAKTGKALFPGSVAADYRERLEALEIKEIGGAS